jgi:BMFP domain-containing protein YqiC
MDQPNAFMLQILGAHVWELAMAKARLAQLEQRVAELEQAPTPDGEPLAFPKNEAR